MPRHLRTLAAGIATAGTFALAACGGHDNRAATSNGDVSAAPATVPAQAAPATPVDTAPATHHSKLGGALVGAAVGHVLGGHAVAGAAAGALVQHERNKHQ